MANVFPLENYGFINHKYDPFHDFACMLSIIFFIIFMISLDIGQTKRKLEKIEPNNDVIAAKFKQNRIKIMVVPKCPKVD